MMHIIKLCLLLASVCTAFGNGDFPSIKVLESTLDLAARGTAISGARLVNQDPVEGIKDVTFCIRFNYQMLGSREGISQLIRIEDWTDGTNVCTVCLFLVKDSEFSHIFYRFMSLYICLL